MQLFCQILAIFVSGALLCYIYAKDPKREPLKTVFKTFMLGFLAVLPSMFLENMLDFIFSDIAFSQRLCYSAIDSFLFTGLVEEFFKFVVLMLFIWNHKDYDDTFDGIVYGVFVSLGFAMLENVFYIYSLGIETALVRAFFVGHFVFGVFMGHFLSKARCAFYGKNKNLKRKYLAFALLIPTVFHGLYDFLLEGKLIYLIVFSVFYLGIIFFAFKLVKREAAQDHSMIQ